jgi:RND family efflux transporter MFP subunit
MRKYTCIVLSVLIAISAGCSKPPKVEAKQDTGPIAVETVKVAAREMPRTVDSTGTLFPFDEAVISAEIEGKILEVTVDLGDPVEKGQVMVRLSDEEQSFVVAQTEAQLRMALERLGLKNEDDKLADVRNAPDVRLAKANVVDADQRYKRLRTLTEQGIGAQADLDQAQAKLNALQAAYDSSINQARNLVRELDRFRASLGLQRKKLRDCLVRAPFKGVVKERPVTVGQFVVVNAPLLTLVKTDPIRLRVDVPERMAPWIKVNQIVDVSLEAFAGKTFKGKIWRIAPTVDQSKRTFVVEALIENPTGQLKPGSYARAHMPTNKIDLVKLVPAKAVNYVLGSNRAYVVANGQIDARELKLGQHFDQDVEVLEGLEAGEVVATTQLNRLDTGSKVSVIGDAKAAIEKAGQ